MRSLSYGERRLERGDVGVSHYNNRKRPYSCKNSLLQQSLGSH